MAGFAISHKSPAKAAVNSTRGDQRIIHTEYYSDIALLNQIPAVDIL
jgi:hypothetical protein